ncbi:plasmid stability protein [Kaistia hirudinis]|uniref:Plasmid stability protein n=1 Tax=Kaistia hirudinis TaxID=1293440 RepID=A0A840AKF0_9HYPH|nr:ribbon-helix-helix protein, CopG family [Kaistia hirudinis]MBB3929065.1 plasmid stability protein [Kaistia hirudinis]
MAQMLVRNIDDDIAERFKAKAKAEGKSAEQAMRDLIEGYAADGKAEALARLDAIRKRVGPITLDPVAIIREDRDTDHGRL